MKDANQDDLASEGERSLENSGHNIVESDQQKQVPETVEIVLPDNSPTHSFIVTEPPKTNTMEVHHHPDIHHNKKNFREYFLEFLMIFIAVTLGFFAESYREYSVEKARAKEYANSLVNDLRKDTAMVQVNILQMMHIASKIDSLSSFLKNKEISGITNRQLFVYTAFSSLYRPYTWSRATLDEIKSSGSLRYLGNDSIIMRISAYDALTKHMDQDFNNDEAASAKIREKCNSVIDMNYSLPDSVNYTLINADSIMNILLKNNNNQDGLHLLAGNLNDIKSLLNDYINIRRSFYIRGKLELPHVAKEADELITILQKEYNLSEQ